MFFFNGDARFFYPENLTYFSGIPQAWDASLNTGVGQNALHTLWINTYLNFSATFSYLGIPWIYIHLFFWIFPAIIFSFLFAYKLYIFFFPESKISALFSGFIYTINTYVILIILGGQAGIGLAYAITPLVILRFFQLFDKCTLQNSLYAGLTLSILLLFDPRWVYMAMIAVFLFWLIKGYLRFINTRKLVYWFFIPGIVVVTLHNYWIVPLLKFKNNNPIQGIGNSDSFAFFSFADFSHSFSLLHPNWPENIFGKTYFMEPIFILIPIIAFASLLGVKRIKVAEKVVEMNLQTKIKNEQYLIVNKLRTYRNILFFAFLGITGAFLAKGVNEPLGNINIWIYTKIPGMMMFRDPTKWFTLVAVSYSILIPFSISKISGVLVNFRKYQKLSILPLLKIRRASKLQINSKIHRSKSLPALFNKATQTKYILYALFILLWLLIHGMTYFSYPMKPLITTVPQEYIQLKEFIYRENTFYRTLWIPQWQRFGYFSNLNPALGRGEIIPIADPNYMAKQLNDDKIIQELKYLGVKYIILPYDSEKEFFLRNRIYDESLYLNTKKTLDTNPYLSKKIHFGKIIVYELNNIKDRFWTVSPSKLNWNEISATEYEIKLENDKINELVVFSDNFDANWVAYYGDTRIYSENFRGSLNSFKIPAGINELKILYEPQVWVKGGLIVSSLSFLILSIIIIKLKKAN